MQEIWTIGLMCGTSFDAIDAALIKTDGEKIIEYGDFISIPLSEALQNNIRAHLKDPLVQLSSILKLERDITIAHADAVKKLLQSQKRLEKSDIKLIGFHGQTIFHKPEEGLTCQLGNGALLAELTGINVICDFRRRDIAAGGEGAPMVPVFHAALCGNVERPVAVVNIGGVANVTYIGKNGDILAFDTGPGNALLDDWIFENTGETCDYNGKYSGRGTANDKILNDLLSHPYFDKIPPKSLDRNSFGFTNIENLSVNDAAATLVNFTCLTIAQATRFFSSTPKHWIICGGGRKNLSIIFYLKALLGNVVVCEDYGWNGDAIEAQAFAYLAARSYYNLPISYPTTTGVKHPISGGALYI